MNASLDMGTLLYVALGLVGTARKYNVSPAGDPVGHAQIHLRV